MDAIRATENIIRRFLDDRLFWTEQSKITNVSPQIPVKKYSECLGSYLTESKGDGSNARGIDLTKGTTISEVKCCSIIDQLNKCKKCKRGVAAYRSDCECGSKNIKYNDDTKWLLYGPKSKMEKILRINKFYCFIFDYENRVTKRESYVVRAYEIATKTKPFVYCLWNYLNVLKSSTQLNLWPYHLKFDLMMPSLIYECHFDYDEITTTIFPNRDQPRLHYLKPLSEYGAKNLNKQMMQSIVNKVAPSYTNLCDIIAQYLYRIEPQIEEDLRVFIQ